MRTSRFRFSELPDSSWGRRYAVYDSLVRIGIVRAVHEPSHLRPGRRSVNPVWEAWLPEGGAVQDETGQVCSFLTREKAAEALQVAVR
ncbi:MAG TPA: hypothetical protein VK600_01370 [Candidatus Saccharimonadales bacterium]|nr:hypothetical protein [Candidatus Saccharimonadales bacterium]